MSANRKTLSLLIVLCFSMLGLGFASKPLYDTFCRITGYGGTTGYSKDNFSEILERAVKVNFDSKSNIAGSRLKSFKVSNQNLRSNIQTKASFGFEK